MVHSIVLYAILVLGCVFANLILVFAAPMIMGVYTSLLIHYCIVLSKMNNVDFGLLRYAAEYECSDGPL
jgi:hypothetical protein